MAKQPPRPASDFDFAKAMAELEEIADFLESDDIDLAQAIKKFERGAQLAVQLKTYLAHAETKIQTIKKNFDSQTDSIDNS